MTTQLFRIQPDGLQRQEIRDISLGVHREAKYPSVWFEANESKPVLTVVQLGEAFFQPIRRTAVTQFPLGTLDHRMAVGLLL